MLMSDIVDRVLVEVGDLYLTDLNGLGVRPDAFLKVVKNALDYWNGYRYRHHQIVYPALDQDGVPRRFSRCGSVEGANENAGIVDFCDLLLFRAAWQSVYLTPTSCCVKAMYDPSRAGRVSEQNGELRVYTATDANNLEERVEAYPADPYPGLNSLPIFVTDVTNHIQYNQLTNHYQYDKPRLFIKDSVGSTTTDPTQYLLNLSSHYKLTRVPKFVRTIPAVDASVVDNSNTPSGFWDAKEIRMGPSPTARAAEPDIPSVGSSDLECWEIQGMEDEERISEFMSLLSAHFMIALGRTRRAFLLNDSPMQIDSDALVSDGQQQLQEIKEQITETADHFETLLDTPVNGVGGTSGWF